MRIALLDSFPNLEKKAELEFIARFHIAAAHLGIESGTVVTSDDIADYKPDLVLSTHEYSRKLTEIPTIGLLWSPLSFFDNDPYRIRSVLSYDGYLAGSERTRRYLKDLQLGLGVEKPVGERLFLPTSCRSAERGYPRPSDASLCYIGVHWDGDRHADLLTALAARGSIALYGPASSWRGYNHSYRGTVDFDGRSVQRTIASHGIALCLHKQEHRAENTPSMRIFEALSVGALLICDRIQFAVDHLSDVAFFVDLDDSVGALTTQIEQIIAGINRDPMAAAERATRGRAWFETTWSLEVKIEQDLLPTYERVLQSGAFRTQPPLAPRKARRPFPWARRQLRRGATPEVDVIVRAGGRSLDSLERAVDSVRAANSSALPLGVTIVDYAGRPDIVAWCSQKTTEQLPLSYLRSPSTGFRSTALWDGLKASTAPYVAHLDDDDSVFANHYRHLHATLLRNPQANVAFSGSVRLEEDGAFFAAPNFEGELQRVIPERRNLEFLEAFDLPRLARLDNYILSHAWMARRTFLQSLLADDPELVVSEDTYLYLLMSSAGPLAFTGSATAVWHWRTYTGDNSMLNVDPRRWAEAARRIARMLGNISFNLSLPLAQIAALGREETPPPPPSILARPPIDSGAKLVGGLQIGKWLGLSGFHNPEADGVWTASQTARIDINPAERLRREGGVLTIRLIAAPIPEPGGKWFEMELDGGQRIRRDFEHAEEEELSLPLAAGHDGAYRVAIRVWALLPGGLISNDMRSLGAYVKMVRIDPPGTTGLLYDLAPPQA